MTPKRIQRQRTKGWRMPAGAVYVGRPSLWGNPFHRLPKCREHPAKMLSDYRLHAELEARLDDGWLAPLRGRDLACWCPLDQPCHADVLLELANR